MNLRHTISVAALLSSLGFAATAHAQHWAANHPWRAGDNGRLANQNARITRGVQDGQLSHAQAHQLRADDHSIRTQERADASVNGTHLTGQDQRQINAQENANSAAIYGERHPQ